MGVGSAASCAVTIRNPQSPIPNQQSLYPLYDGSGNILALTDSTGTVVSTTSYTAFGEVISSSLRSASGGEAISFGFSTKPFSSATRLSYFGARHYSPSLSRWLTPDPLGQLDGPNVYLYVRNSPLNFIDPWGLLKQKTEGDLWGEFSDLEGLNGPTPEQLKRAQELLDEIGLREVIRPVPLSEDPATIILIGLKPSVPFKINVPGLSEPTHIGLDLWGKNIIHYGRSVIHLPGRHIALWFNESGTGLLHIYRDRVVIARAGKPIIKFYKNFFQ